MTAPCSYHANGMSGAESQRRRDRDRGADTRSSAVIPALAACAAIPEMRLESQLNDRSAYQRLLKGGLTFPSEGHGDCVIIKETDGSIMIKGTTMNTKKTKARTGNNWVRNVKTVSTFPAEKLFTKDAETIARAMASKKVSPKGIGSGIRMVQYFINRAGKGLSPTRKQELEKAKRILQEKARRKGSRQRTAAHKALQPV